MKNIKKKCGIYVLNYNGSNLLKKCLGSIAKAAKYISGNVIVIDNNSSDNSVSFIQHNFPEVIIKSVKTNNYLFSYNQAIKEDPYDYAILLNNDVFVEDNFVQSLLEHFDDSAVFAVGGKILGWEGAIQEVSRRVGRFEWGLFFQGPATDFDNAGYTLYVSGGSIAVDKKKFLELGGFDALYRPFYFEDLDICYRAWKRGWKCVYEPNSVVYHKISVSIDKIFTEKQKKIIFTKSCFLFCWKNVTDPKLIFQICTLLPLELIRACLHRDWVFLKGFWLALRRIGEILKKRRVNRSMEKFSDREICMVSQENIQEIE